MDNFRIEMSEQVIKSPVFDSRGGIPNSILAQLGIRGSQEHIDEALVRHSWGSRDPVVVPVLTTEASNGRIIGSRLAVRGKIAKYDLKANSLWGTEVGKNVSLSFDLDGSDFAFSARGASMPGK